jgi:hypothetical protein
MMYAMPAIFNTTREHDPGIDRSVRVLRKVLGSSPRMTGSNAADFPAATRKRLYRPSAAFNAGTRSVFSHVNVPFVSSGSRPK